MKRGVRLSVVRGGKARSRHFKLPILTLPRVDVLGAPPSPSTSSWRFKTVDLRKPCFSRARGRASMPGTVVC